MCEKCGIVKLSMKFDDLEPEMRRIAQLIYDGKLKPGQIDKAMVKKIAEQLMNVAGSIRREQRMERVTRQ